MAEHPRQGEADLRTLVKEIVSDSERLVGQQLELLRAEVGRELGEAKRAAVELGAGTGLVATAGLFSALTLVHALHRATRMPLWACYGAVAALLGVSGAALLEAGRREAAGVRLWPPPETTAALKENLQWVKDQVT